MTSPPTPHENQTLALAALYQALASVTAIAAEGRHDDATVRVCLQGLLHDADTDLTQVYGPVSGLRLGLEQLQLQVGAQPNLELTRYAIALLHLERKATRRPPVLRALGAGLERARRQQLYFGGINQSVAAALAELYSSTISTLHPRIVVKGRREWLEDADRAALIRCLLLAGLRAVTFWKQAGGGRLQLIFGRQRLRDTAARLAGSD
jgi:high frequency lysogenization protein